MPTTLSDLLSDIRRSLGVTGKERPRVAAVDERLERTPKGVLPQRGQVAGAERIALFRRMAEAVQTSVEQVDAPDKVPAAIAAWLRSHNLPAVLRMGEDLRLKAMPWQDTALDLSVGRSHGSDLNAVSHAFAGVAETGTLVLASGPENPTTLNFLPDNHVVVIAAKDIGGDMEEAMARLRRSHGKGALPRTVNFVTGPSRSADIGQTLELGAHGPRRLHVVVVG